LANDLDPWERQPDESPQAWEAFVKYRDQPPSQRSYRRVAQELSKSGALINRWRQEWQWVFRAEQYDAHEDQLRQERLHAAQEAALAMFREIGHAGLVLTTKELEILHDREQLRPRDLGPLLLAFAKLECLGLGLPFGVSQETVDGRRERGREGANALRTAAVEWSELQPRLLDALGQFPKARLAVIAALEAMERE
jgi:hypothetical protein